VRRTLLATLAATSLVLAGCGGSDSSASNGSLDSVTVSKAADPKVTVKKGFKATKTTTRVLKKGPGAEVASGDSIKVKYVAINGRTGKAFDNSFTSNKPLTITLAPASILAGFIKGLTKQTVGSRVLVAIAPKDGFNKAQSSLNLKKNDTMVFLFDIIAKVPPIAAGKAHSLPSDLPKLVLDSKHQPTKFAKTSKMSKKQTKESAHVVIQGTGPVVTLGETLNVQYLGQIYPTGKVFDSSWARGAPTSFALTEGSLIKCWTDKLVGQRVGSRVILVCPADVAYKKAGSPPDIKGGDTLIFSIDLLDAF
jgi:FKBP-type peptidyl-prolyl cis-trans isomerase